MGGKSTFSIGRFLTTVVLTGAVLAAAQRLIWPRGARFAFLVRPGETLPDGEPLQEVRLAAAQRPTLPTAGWTARDLQLLIDNRGDGSPETIDGLHVSPSGRRLLVASTALPEGAIDFNHAVFRLADAVLLARFNWHSVAPQVNRNTWPSPRFASLLAQFAADGIPAAELAAMNFAPVTDIGRQTEFAAAVLGWIDEDTVAIRWSVTLATDGLSWQEDVLTNVRFMPGPNVTLVAPPSAAVLPLPPTMLGLDAAGRVAIGGLPVGFRDAPGAGPTAPRVAQAVAGLIAP